MGILYCRTLRTRPAQNGLRNRGGHQETRIARRSALSRLPSLPQTCIHRRSLAGSRGSTHRTPSTASHKPLRQATSCRSLSQSRTTGTQTCPPRPSFYRESSEPYSKLLGYLGHDEGEGCLRSNYLLTERKHRYA